jgi:rhodanese-related sulfurtransferase
MASAYRSALAIDTQMFERKTTMSAPTDTPTLPQALEAAQAVALATGLPYAGGVSPATAWQLFSQEHALLVDVRSAEERKFVGHVPRSLHVPWATGTSLTRNPRFVRELEAKTGRETPVLLLCRSGKRSVLAAEAAAKAGLTLVFNVLEGFEGEINAQGHRGTEDGWRFHQLPWVQD